MSSLINLLVLCVLLATVANVESIKFVVMETETDPVVATITETVTVELCVSLVDVTGGCRRKRDAVQRQDIAASAVQQMETTRTARLSDRDISRSEALELSSSLAHMIEGIDITTARQLMKLNKKMDGRILTWFKATVTVTESPNVVTETTTSPDNFYVISGCTPPVLFHPICQ